MTLIFSLSTRASKARGSFRVAIVGQEPHLAIAVVGIHQQVARLLEHPRRVRAAGAGEILNPAAAHREEHEHVEAAQPDGVDGEEVAGEDRLAMRSQETAPRLRLAPRSRRHPSLGEDVADGGRRDGDTQLAQLTDDPQVAPVRVLAREPQDQFAHVTTDRLPAWTAMRVGPAPSHQPPMPVQQRLRSHEESVPGAPRQHAAESRQQ
jgi:hypothetical protein